MALTWLREMLGNWGREERNKINQNWEDIEKNYAGVLKTSNDAKDTSTTAAKDASDAKRIAEGIDGKATDALITSRTANQKSDIAVSTADSAKNQSEYVQSQLDNVIVEGESSAEVVQARVGYANLRDRLDKEKEEVTSQLAHIVVDISQHGAKTGSDFDNTAIIQNLYNSLSAGDTLFIPKGNYYITNLIFDKDDVDVKMNGTFIQTAGATGTAVQIGSLTKNTNRVNGNINVKKASRNWSQENTGLKILNSNECEITVIADSFTTNLHLEGDARGTAYNTITPKRLVNGFRNLRLNSINEGWCNENKFIGGRLAWTSNVTQVETDAYNLVIEQGCNNNVFFSTSLEGSIGTLFYCEGAYNTLYSPRLERYDNARTVHFTLPATHNRIVYPLTYDSILGIYFVDEGTRNHIYGRDIIKYDRTQLRPDNIRMRGNLNGNPDGWESEAVIDVASVRASSDKLFAGRNALEVITSTIDGNGNASFRSVSAKPASNADNVFGGQSATGVQTSRITGNGDGLFRRVGISDENFQEVFAVARNGNAAQFWGTLTANNSYAVNPFAPFAVINTGVKPSAVTPPGAGVVDTTAKKLYVSLGNGNYMTFNAAE